MIIIIKLIMILLIKLMINEYFYDQYRNHIHIIGFLLLSNNNNK